MLAEAIINTYLDANILLALAFTLWSLVHFIISKTNMRRSHTTQLKLLNGVIFVTAASPVLIYYLSGWSTQHALNLTDIIVAQYLDGNVEINPSTLESFLGMREDFVRSIVQLGTPVSITLAAVFTLGFIGFSAKVIHNIYALHSILKNCRPWRKFGRKYILLSDTVLVPFSTRALRNHYIVIPTAMLGNSKDVRMAISHELQHFRQRDIEWAILLEFLTPVFFWNPAFYLWKLQVTKLREFACDQNLITRLNYDLRSYCDCLIRTSMRNLRGNKNYTLVSPAVAMVETNGNASLLGQRILALTSNRETGFSQKLFALLIVPLTLAVTLTAILIQSPADWSQDRLMLSTIVNLERLDARNSLGVPPGS